MFPPDPVDCYHPSGLTRKVATFKPESLETLLRIQWKLYSGLLGNFPPEFAIVCRAHTNLACAEPSPTQTTVSAAGQLTFTLDRARLRTLRGREGRYLLRTNLSADNPELLWRCYMQLVFVEEAFRTLKGDLGLRPIYHHKSERIEAHLFVAFLAYCLSITLRQRLKALAGGLMPRVIFEKLAMLQLLDVRIPTTDGRELLLVRRTEPDRDVALLLARLNLQLPPQPPPRISQLQAN